MTLPLSLPLSLPLPGGILECARAEDIDRENATSVRRILVHAVFESLSGFEDVKLLIEILTSHHWNCNVPSGYTNLYICSLQGREVL